ncbi:MAG: 6-bladed beta-propeller [Prevotellaceae bacterium]|nr:6-bladed beta-propeller [Prevotellaceae bacterium]
MCKYFIISLITFFLVACNYQKPLEQKRDCITIPINPKEALKSVNASGIFSDIEYIPLESVDKHLIGTVQQLIAYKDRFYIFDRYRTQSVFCFQQDGKFLFELNRKGQGPDEYVELIILCTGRFCELLYYCG